MMMVTHLVDLFTDFYLLPCSKFLFNAQVYHMGICSRCKQFLNATHHKLDQEEKVSAMNALVKLFSNHINKIVAYTKKCNPNISCIMWDDMLRDLDLPTLQGMCTIN